MPDLLELTAEIVAAYVGHNKVGDAQLPELVRSIYVGLTKTGQPMAEVQEHTPAVPIKKSAFNDHLVCLECGENFRVLKRHLQTDHELTIEQYRERFRLPRDYPMIAPEYAQFRSRMAKKIGLGIGGRAGHKKQRKRA